MSRFAQTKMMSFTSGRVVGTHPNITCDHCKHALGDGEVRYACLDCADYDLCGRCENSASVTEGHYGGQHLFAKVRDSTAVNIGAYREAVGDMQ